MNCLVAWWRRRGSGWTLGLEDPDDPGWATLDARSGDLLRSAVSKSGAVSEAHPTPVSEAVVVPFRRIEETP